MRSAVARYKSLLSTALARYFPRTAAYLQAERDAAELQKKPTPRKRKGAATPRKAGERKAKAKSPTSRQAIYGPGLIRIESGQVSAMREQVALAVTAGVVSAPSDEQWAMILGDHPLTRVFAGAGSGKSTTLVLRVVFMLCHLNIDPARVTVISFTNASCAQLREQLLKVLAFWSYPFDTAQARQCVRTFHSAMGAQAKALLGNPSWFELLDDKGAAKAELDNPLASSRLGAAQQRLLRQVYQQCYSDEPGFRLRVHELLDLPAPSEPLRKNAKAPLDAYKTPGEFSAVPLFEAFHQQASFMESIGLCPERVDASALNCSARERAFTDALMMFSRAFHAHLQGQGVMTFNRAFEALTQHLAKDGGADNESSLTSCTHLLIDEFQDISPNIVQWLQAVQRRLARGGQAVTLMAIGDDWQSIYGWRGSSPELFMDFDRHFPGKGKAGKSAVLKLETNYRSIEPVIRDAEAVLAGVTLKQDKASRAFKSTESGDHGVKVIQRFSLKTQLAVLLKEIEAQCVHVASRSTAERTAVLVLSRRNDALQSIQAQLDKRLPVKAYTIHRAKGLQAEVAIIVDDCQPPESHPLRNAWYAHCGFFSNSYDQAMRDEALRLAYVAVTRGVSRVLWFTQKAQGAAQLLADRSGRRGSTGGQ
ncbi:MAG: UvrD-helicase domain-containing protein [Pseudomonas sp.]|uniref:UvrD-helicase domain-containing protein n=1 Tax=Pseudomonas sp. TaxID=306 RepID=UPI003D113440